MPNTNVPVQVRKDIDAYLIQNPIDREQHHPYEETAKKFDVEEEYIRSRFRFLRRKGHTLSKSGVDVIVDKAVEKLNLGERTFSVNSQGQGSLSLLTNKRIKTKEDLIKVAEIDLKHWNIVTYEVTTWEVGRKNKVTNLTWKSGAADGFVDDKGNFVTETLYRVNIKLSPRKLDKDLGLQKEAIIEELRAYSPIVKAEYDYEPEQRNLLLEICTFDLHLGSLSWGQESGENYDIKIAEDRFKTSVRKLLKKVNLNQVERILFPIGNDLMNTDNKNNTTTNGTVVDTDVRFLKMLKIARRIMMEMIDELSLIAPVDVLVIPGNHDATVSLVLGEILDAVYTNNEKVTIFGSPKTRKYYQYGLTSIMLSHGDEENHKDLGLIFATEAKNMWADTEYRFCQLGHFHKNKKTSYLSVDEHPGFQVQILPTLSSATAWAYKKGYHSLKQAKAFLFDKKEGMVGEFTTTV